MKIIFLNPKIDAEHNVSKSLQEKGVALLFPQDETEAWQMLMLHGTSVDLGIIHREGLSSQNAGLQFIEKVKNDPSQSDLPMILTSDDWGDSECAEHQASPFGVNAYLKAPFTPRQLIEVIEGVLGQSLGASTQSKVDLNLDGAVDPGAPVLEDMSLVFSRPETDEQSDSKIRLEAPSVSEEVQDLPLAESPPQPESLPLEDLKSPAIHLTSVDSLSPSAIEINPSEPLSESLSEPSQISLQPSLEPQPEYVPEPQASSAPLEDPEAKQQMPYLFENEGHTASFSRQASLILSEPLGDAVIPGGAAQSPDLETIKRYLLLREQDVGVLSSQLKVAHDHVTSLENELSEEKAKNTELSHLAHEQKQRIENFEKEKLTALESLQQEVQELNFQIKAKTDKVRLVENQLHELSNEMESLKERVRSDIRKIRVREKELENRLEIVKKDSEALIGARESKIIELKRKLDLLEFNMDLLQDQYSREKETSTKLRERLSKAAQVVRVAGGLLDSNPNKSIESLEMKDLDSENEKKQEAS